MRTKLMSGAATLSLAVAACAVLAAAPAQAALDKPVQTKNGLVSGMPGSAPGVTEFRGIPFGAAPVGPLRWREPQPVANWTGVRDGSKWGDTCIQPSGKARRGVNLATRPAGFAEDVGGLPQPERLHPGHQGRPEAAGDGLGLWRRL